MADLKLCPFCGNEPERLNLRSQPEQLSCAMTGCPANSQWVDPDVWNRRAPAPSGVREAAQRVWHDHASGVASPEYVWQALRTALAAPSTPEETP